MCKAAATVNAPGIVLQYSGTTQTHSMFIQNPKGDRRMRIEGQWMWFTTKVDGKWMPWTQHYNQYNGLMEYNEALHQLGWREVKPAV